MKGDIFTAAKDFGVLQGGIVAGLMLGAAYDVLRIIRAIIPHGRVTVFIGDFLYMLLFGFCLFTYSVGTVYEVRYYIVFAFVMGLLAEKYAFGNYVVNFVNKISEKIRSIVKKYCQITYKKFKKTMCVFGENAKNSKNYKKVKKGLES